MLSISNHSSVNFFILRQFENNRHVDDMPQAEGRHVWLRHHDKFIKMVLSDDDKI